MKNQKTKNMIFTTTTMSGSMSWDDWKNLFNTIMVFLTIVFNKYLEISGLSKNALNILVFLLISDTLLGRAHAHKSGHFENKKAFWGFVMKFALLIVPVAIKALTNWISVENNLLFNSYCVVVALNEVQSCIAHLYFLRTGIELPQKDWISLLLKAIHQFLNGAISKVISSVNNNKTEKDGEKK